MVRSLQQKKFRDELGLFVAEGRKCVEELSKAFELVLRIDETNATRTEIEQMSGLRTPQGVIGVFKKKPIEDCKLETGGLTLALDGIQDPGNLGTIIRTCDWFGIDEIVCSLDTADCYNPKVVQATMGSLARVHIHYVDLPKWLSNIKHQTSNIAIYGTLLEGRNMYEVLKEQPLAGNRSPLIIVMGNEGNGISEPVRRLIMHPIRIPSCPHVGSEAVHDDLGQPESLNVAIATAIVLAEFKRP